MDIDDAPKLFANLSKAFEQAMPKVLMNMANVGAAEVQARVFNRGQSADGATMHYRSKGYIKKRQAFGRQVAQKDLIFTGDMANSLTLRTKSPLVVEYAFNNDGAALIAGYQEDAGQVGKPIFKLNTTEINTVEKAGIKDVQRISKAVIDSFPNMPTFKGEQAKQTKRTVRTSTVANRKKAAALAKNVSQRKTKRKY